MLTNQEQFRAVYIKQLAKDHAKDPDKFWYPSERIPEIVGKMVVALARGTGSNSNAIKRTAKQLGIMPTLTAIRDYLS